ncbi:MAG: hypothetical protein K2H96_09760 [Muribaculaceae bacterium]|nr:hypothetical protein [Muribaculaceae bacterium]
MKDNDIDFVAKHYCKGAFSTEKALHRMGFVIRDRWKAFRIAVAVVSIVAVTAVASIVIHNEYVSKENAQEIIVKPAREIDLKAVRSIDFENAPLPVVIEEIKTVYGVEVAGLPEEAEAYHLTLHYEGNAVDLVETINEILDTKLTVKE